MPKAEKPAAVSGLLGNVQKDGLYVAPWGQAIKCYILTDYGDPPVCGIVAGKNSTAITADFEKRMKANLRPKAHEVLKVEGRWVFVGVRDHDNILRAENERREQWPSVVIGGLACGRENAKSAKELADWIGCKDRNLRFPKSEWLFPKNGSPPGSFDYHGTTVHYSFRGFWLENKNEQPLL